ncbi:MAG: putative Ig domain-containing protein, partial [Actinobacteria bacterium]|nr:putative Ig domain-containing protein [Actinomycetota bacterium]MBV9255824.1 putative Ig domain-containing protein [Actinomycetota bacterium]
TQAFTLTVEAAPAFTSAKTATFVVGQVGTFTVKASGTPKPTITMTGTAPSGVTFTDNADGTGTLTGTPAPGQGGVAALTFTASNGMAPQATQSFTLTVNEAPTITSADNATFTIGDSGTFTVSAAGYPRPALSKPTGTLPAGVTFNAATGILSGTPASGTTGVRQLTFKATNGAGSFTQTFTLTVASAVKPVLKGLLDRQGRPDDANLAQLDGWVVRVDWAALQPTPFGPIDTNNAIDQAIAQVRTLAPQYTMHLKVRVLAGTSAPDWAKQLDGGPIQLDSSAGDSIGLFWSTDFASAYADLQSKLAALYDDTPEISQVEITQCTIWTGEPFLRDAGTPQTVSALLAFGYTAEADSTCQQQEVDAHQVWAHTRSGLAFNPYQHIYPDGSSSTDEPFTESMMTYCRSSLGLRCVLANNSIRSTPQGPSYTDMYNAMQANGRPMAFQTAAPDRIGDWYQALSFAVQLGANSIELARDYPTYDPTQLESIRQQLLS